MQTVVEQVNVTEIIEQIKTSGSLTSSWERKNIQFLVQENGIQVKYYLGHPTSPNFESFEFFEGVTLDDTRIIINATKLIMDYPYMRCSLHYSEEVAVRELEALGCFDIKAENPSCPKVSFKKEIDGEVYTADFALSRTTESEPFTFNNFQADSNHESLNALITHYRWAIGSKNPSN